MGRVKSEKAKLDALSIVSKGVKSLAPISAMEEIQVVPTLFTSYNRATGLGGHPRGRVTVVHGPPQKGKTTFTLGLLESMRRAGDVPSIFDAEFVAEKIWYGAISPKSYLAYPETLDDLYADIQKMLDNLAAAKIPKKKDEPPELDASVGCTFAIDTLVKLNPKDLAEVIKKEGIEKRYPYQAYSISQWMKSIVPQVFRSNSSLILVMQERRNLKAKTEFDKQYVLPLGDAIQYDNCMRVRVAYNKNVKRGEQIIGVESHYTLENNKADGTTLEKGVFFTSNGKGDLPKGLDLYREAIEECKYRGWLEKDKEGVEVKPLGWHVEGGWEDLREALMGDQKTFKALVAALNKDAARKVEKK